jgi:hypothetical protein
VLRAPLAMLVLVLAGCPPPDGNPPDAARAADAPAPDASAVSETGAVRELGSGSGSAAAGAPIAGAMVCLPTSPGAACASSSADGSYTLRVPGLPANAQAAVSAVAAGHFGTVVSQQEYADATTWPAELVLRTTDDGTALLAGAGLSVTPGSGYAIVTVYDVGSGGALAGAALQMSPAPAGGPIYAGADGAFDPALTKTTSSGLALFAGIPPGEFTVRASGGRLECHYPAVTRLTGTWDGSGSLAAGLAIADAFNEGVIVACQYESSPR